MLGPIRATSVKIKKNEGNNSTISMIREISMSSPPPKYPASAPRITPTVT